MKILRLAAPRIRSTLSEDNITINPEDLASELQYCVNCQLTYGGMTPYACLFGTAPRELWSDESDFVSNDEGGLPFWEMAHVRHRSIGAFHQALLRFRLERSLKARPRTDLAQNYTIGQLIDVYIKTAEKISKDGVVPVLSSLSLGRAGPLSVGKAAFVMFRSTSSGRTLRS